MQIFYGPEMPFIDLLRAPEFSLKGQKKTILVVYEWKDVFVSYQL